MTFEDAIMHRPSPDLSDPARNLEESVGTPSPTKPDPNVDLSMPPDEDVIELDEARVHTPPPHIAARFYRPTQARRKDSAASSRRNSMSSAHSRTSVNAFSRHGGPQSKYVAQHLRRASFLEDRKARLADRAAHAEKVRLRAAIAKASTRDTSAFEERALAAQQARERNLAEIVASCAEEVKRAKAVAESMKEKREQELVKMRTQMEERLAEAERRREELRKSHAAKRGRGQSIRKAVEVMPQVKETEAPAMSEEVAVGKMQQWWRASNRRRAVRAFSDLGLSVDGVRDTSFEKVVELLAQERVLLVTARVLRICGLQEGGAGSVDEMAAVRTFLSAFLILGHPTQVLSNKDAGSGEQEQDLVGKARDLLIVFENILSRLTSTNNYTPPPALLQSLPEAYATFYNAFIAWKSRDSNALIEVMLMQFVELDAIWQTVKDGNDDDSSMEPYRQSIKENQLMLIVRIKKLAGQEKGKKMIFEAVRQARKARAKKPAGDTKPRVTEETAQQGESSTSARGLVSQESRILSPPPTPSRSSASESKSAPPGAAWRLLPDNRIVVHELAINREYQIPASEYAGEQHQNLFGSPVIKQMRAAAEAGNENASFALFIIIAKSMSEKLQRLVKEGNSMHSLIREMFDPQIAEQQFALGSWSYERFFLSVSALLPKLCAPYRDDELKALIENKLQGDGTAIDRAEALSGFIDVMVCDYINWMLRISAPGLIEAAPQYEAKRFAEEFAVATETGSNDSFPAAEAAWRMARSKVLAEVNRRDTEGINHPKSRPTAEKIYTQMLVDVFTQPSPVPDDKVPEMLRLDRLRVARISTQILRIITAGAILLQCKNLLKRDARAPWKTEAARIFTVLESKDPQLQTPEAAVEGVMAALEAGRSMPAATKGHLRALATKVLQASRDSAANGSEPREPVLRLLLQRLRGHILLRLSASTSSSATEKVRATSTAGEKLANLGMPEFVGRVQEVVDEVAKVGAVDRAAHSAWWEAVADKVATIGAGSSGSAGSSRAGTPSSN